MKNISIIIAFLLLLFFTSCQGYRYVNTVKDLPPSVIEEYSLNNFEKYTLQPYDYLYINIRSTNADINELYSRISSTYAHTLNNNESNFFLTGYLVNDSGYVFVPTLGELYVKGLTIDQTRTLIQDKVSEILSDAVVNVRLTSFNVSFLGEVNIVGRFPFYRERVNILEGVAMAGGITYYGDKKRIKVLRAQDTVIKVYDIDLTNKNILDQKEFFLQPNDIVYVPPRKQQDFLNFIKDYSSFVTVLTSTLTTTLLILELTK